MRRTSSQVPYGGTVAANHLPPDERALNVEWRTRSCARARSTRRSISTRAGASRDALAFAIRLRPRRPSPTMWPLLEAGGVVRRQPVDIPSGANPRHPALSRPMTISRRYVAMLAVCLGVMCSGPSAPAWAGNYTVLACRDRGGASLPLNDASGGWQAGSTGGPGLDAVDRCEVTSHGFLATVSGIWPHAVGQHGLVALRATVGHLVEGADILYSGYSRTYDGQNRGIIYLNGAQAGYLATSFGEGAIAARWAIWRGLHDSWLQATAQCDGAAGSADCPAGMVHATVEILRSEILLADTSPPTAGSASGSAVTSPTWQGTMTFAFPAADDGGGVYQAILEVDGAPVLARTIDDWGGRCVDTTPGQRVFRYPRPCLTSVDALVPVDASALPVGDHDVALRVSDAAGNVRTVYAARKTIVAPGRSIGPGSALAERGAANGDNASDAVRLTARWARTQRSTLTGPFGRRRGDSRAAHRRDRSRRAQRAHRAAHRHRSSCRGADRQGRRADAGRRALHDHPAARRVVPDAGAALPKPCERHGRRSRARCWR